MCITPVTIKNPVYCRASYQLAHGSMRVRDPRLQSKQEFIDVPCGICSDCRNSYFDSILQRGIVESLTSYLYFVTLTYDNDHLPCLQLPNGKVIYYADYSHIQNMFKRFRASNVLVDRDFRYLCCNEYGDKHNRPHFHIILFVAKKRRDTDTTPLFIEKLLFDNLGNNFAINKGTRKHPIYERLFTYRIRFTTKGIKSNYYVKYVKNEHDPYNQLMTDNLTYVKTLRYLLGYVNKGSSFDDTVQSTLTDLKDTDLVKKLRNILTSRVRFSKGFGCGFIDGFLYYVPPQVKKCSFIKGLYSTTSYPPVVDFIDNYTLRDFNRKLLTFDFTLNNIKEDDLYFFYALLTYFPNFVSYINRKYRCINIDTLSYHFQFKWFGYSYVYNKIVTHDVDCYNYLFEYIRNGISLGFLNKIPYLTFPLFTDGKYMSLCDFYKERFVSDADILYMYDILGVKDFDEWLTLFNKHTSTFNADKQMSRHLTHERELLQVNCKSSKIVDNLLITFFT